MAYVLQVDFKMNGPFGDELAKEFSDLARSINEEMGSYGRYGRRILRKMRLAESTYSKQKKPLKHITICTLNESLALA